MKATSQEIITAAQTEREGGDGCLLRFERFTFIPVSFRGGKILSQNISILMDQGRKMIYFTVKIRVKIKLHNPLSLNNFVITNKRLYSVEQVTQNMRERGFSEVRIILYPQLNFKYRRLIRNMQYLKGENIQSPWGVNSVYTELQKAMKCVIWGLSPLLQENFCIK